MSYLVRVESAILSAFAPSRHRPRTAPRIPVAVVSLAPVSCGFLAPFPTISSLGSLLVVHLRGYPYAGSCGINRLCGAGVENSFPAPCEASERAALPNFDVKSILVPCTSGGHLLTARASYIMHPTPSVPNPRLPVTHPLPPRTP